MARRKSCWRCAGFRPQTSERRRRGSWNNRQSAWATGSCTYLQPGTDVDGSAQMLLRTSSGISASISLCGYSVVPIDETMLFFANGSLRLHTGSDLSVTCGSGYETVDTSSYPNAFEAQWADFISGVRAGRILYCD